MKYGSTLIAFAAVALYGGQVSAAPFVGTFTDYNGRVETDEIDLRRSEPTPIAADVSVALPIVTATAEVQLVKDDVKARGILLPGETPVSLPPGIYDQRKRQVLLPGESPNEYIPGISEQRKRQQLLPGESPDGYIPGISQQRKRQQLLPGESPDGYIPGISQQ